MCGVFPPLEGIFGYRIIKVWQLEEEEGREKIQIRTCSLGVWPPSHSSDKAGSNSLLLSPSPSVGTELCSVRVSGEMRMICYKQLMNCGLLALPALPVLLFGLEYLGQRGVPWRGPQGEQTDC